MVHAEHHNPSNIRSHHSSFLSSAYNLENAYGRPQVERFISAVEEEMTNLFGAHADLGVPAQRMHTQEASLGFDKAALNHIIASIGQEGRSA